MRAPLLTPLERDMLTEVATLGASRAAGSIARIVHHNVDIDVPQITLLPLEEVPATMGEAEQDMTVVLIKIIGDATGTILMILTPENANRLVTAIAPGMEASALEEIANIFSGRALGALSKFLGLKLLQTIPDTATDMLRAIINEVTSELGTQEDNVLLMSVGFTVTALGVKGALYYTFDTVSTQQIILKCKQHAGQS